MELISKRRFFKFYLTLILANAFFLGCCYLILSQMKADRHVLAYIFVYFILALIIHMDYSYIKNASKLVLNTKGIKYKGRFYDWDEFKKITLTGKSSIYLGYPAECATLFLNHSKPIEIFDDIYSNAAEMKYFIQEIAIAKKEDLAHLKIEKPVDYDREFFIPYKGNPLLSFRGIVLWSFILFMLFFPLFASKQMNWRTYPFLLFISILFYWFNAWMMYYFEISKNYFRIRNHFFWIKKTYHFADIHEIVFETLPKQPNKLRIITKDFESSVFLAGSLNDKTWLEMKKELESKNITVRNECIY